MAGSPSLCRRQLFGASRHPSRRPDTRRAARTLGIEGLLDEIVFRLIRVRLASGSEAILATSLLDTEVYPAADFSALYHVRWGIEEAFKVLKHRLRVERFTGESPEAIRQDFHAQIFTATLAEALAYSAPQSLPNEKAARYRPNLAYAMARLRLQLFGWLSQRASPDEVLSLLTLIGKTLERQRPGRSAPRPKFSSNPRPRRQYK
jgi:hypothetical protein